jgi:hypothetical protein
MVSDTGMPIPKTKQELLDAMESEFELLKKSFEGLSEKQMTTGVVCGRWSTKDVLSHLIEWKKMFLGWYKAGLRGENPKTPADDLKWNQTRELNERIYQKWKNEPLDLVLAELDGRYKEMLRLARKLSDKDLSTKNLYPWMRVWPLSRWIAANTSSHYRWARTRIRKFAKTAKT